MNLREQIETDLRETLEGDYGIPVVLISPTGRKIDTSVYGGTLYGQVLYETVMISPESGEEITVGNPVVTLRRSSLADVPLAGEKWIVKIPIDPTAGAAIEDFIFDSTRAPGGSRSIGYIKLYLRKTKQS